MKRSSNRHFIALFSLLPLLSGCAITYSRPVPINAAEERLRQTLKTWQETDFSSFSNVSLTSTYQSRNAAHHNFKESMVTTMQYASDPYALTLEETLTSKGSEEKNQQRSVIVSKENDTYMVKEGSETFLATSWSDYSTYSPYFDLPYYFQSHGVSLLNKALELLSRIGTQTNPQSNDLTGFQAKSTGGDDLEVTFNGSDFGIQDHFFQKEYEEQNAAVFSLYISGGRIRSYRVTFTYEEALEIASSSTPEFSKKNHAMTPSNVKEASVENVWNYGA